MTEEAEVSVAARHLIGSLWSSKQLVKPHPLINRRREHQLGRLDESAEKFTLGIQTPPRARHGPSRL